MTKKIVSLNEQSFRQIVQGTVNEVLNEIGYRGAALAHGANYNASMSKIQNTDDNATTKMNKSNNIRLQSLSLAIHDNFPSLRLNFIERDKANQFYTVVFDYQNIKLIDKTRFIMGGDMVVSDRKKTKGNIEFNFNTQSFYRVQFYGNGSVRRMYQMMMDSDYKQVFNDLLSFVSSFMYSEEDYETNVNNNGATMSKRH